MQLCRDMTRLCRARLCRGLARPRGPRQAEGSQGRALPRAALPRPCATPWHTRGYVRTTINIRIIVYYFLDVKTGLWQQLRRDLKEDTLKSVKSSLTREAVDSLTQAFIRCRLDYCNSALAGGAKIYLQKLQSVQNMADRMVSGVCRSEHITPSSWRSTLATC